MGRQVLKLNFLQKVNETSLKKVRQAPEAKAAKSSSEALFDFLVKSEDSVDKVGKPATSYCYRYCYWADVN